MSPRLPAAFVNIPLAHRALHDVTDGRPENSHAAIRAAITAGYGVEIDVQCSADGRAMVFHDDRLDRLTSRMGRVSDHSATALAAIELRGGDEGVPTLRNVLDLVAARVPVLVEIKDQTGEMGPEVGRLEAGVAADLAGYDGPIAVMSFNPHSVACMAELCPDTPRGLVTSRYDPLEWDLPPALCDHLRGIPDYDRVGASFISHEASDLGRARVRDLKARGARVQCWTIRSAHEEAEARKVAEGITFEGYAAAIPA